MKRVFLGLLLFVMLFIVSACTGKDTDRETEQLTEDTSTSFESDTAMPIEDDAEETENQETEMIDMGIFDFETKKVMLNSGYEMPIMGLGTYALDYDTCVSSVKALLFDSLFAYPYDIEHILAQNSFKDGDEEDKGLYNGIGNLVVLERKINREIKDIDVSKKVEEYRKSKYVSVNKKLVSIVEGSLWDREAIWNRCESEIKKIKNFMTI